MVAIYKKITKLSTVQQLILIFLLAFLIRLLMNVIFQGIDSPPNPNMGSDQADYNLMAQSLAHGKWLSLEYLRRPPGMPFLLFTVYYFFGVNYVLARIFLCLLGAATCVIVFFIGRKILNNKIGLLAAIILCFYPMHIYYGMHFLSEVPWAFFMSVAVLCLLLFEEHGNIIYGILAGFFLGFSAYIRPTVLFYLPFYAALNFLSCFFKDKKSFFKFSLIPFLSMVLVITPWVIRNYKLTGHIVLMSINGGRSFWACNNEVVLNEPRLTGRWADLSHLPELPQFLSCRNPYEQDRTAYGYGIKFIKSHLKDMPRLEMMKVYRLFTPFYNTPNKIFNIIGGLSWALLSIFVLWGFIVTFGNTRLNSLYSTVLLTLFIALVFCGDHRFREAIAPFLAVYAAVGWFHFTKWLKSKRQA